jgi:hypothetical protein
VVYDRFYERRGLARNAAVAGEMRRASFAWRPYAGGGDAAYAAYRNSPAEQVMEQLGRISELTREVRLRRAKGEKAEAEQLERAIVWACDQLHRALWPGAEVPGAGSGE